MIERRIIIGLIVSTQFIERIIEQWDVQLISSATAKRIAVWCIDYFNEFKRAPGKEIENIFYQKLEIGKLPKEIAEEIEQDILPGLSEEFENNDLNVDDLVKQTLFYLNKQYLTRHSLKIKALTDDGKLKEAEELAGTYKPLNTTTIKLDKFIKGVKQIRRLKRKQPTILMRPWLLEGQGTIIYGNFGSGKSLLTITVAYVLGLENFDNEETEIGEWRVLNPTGCLYIDGELGELEMEERIRNLEWLGEQAPKYRMRILSIPEYQLETEDSFYLSNRVNQLKIINWLKDNPNYKFIVLDSASTLFGLEDENSNSEWSTKINPFLRDLRALGIAYILLHHSGKNNKRGLRGASAMGAMAHNIFYLRDHESKDPDDGEAWFVVNKDKQRSGGFSFKLFALHFTQDGYDHETHWQVTNIN
jgi:hypothetical protein